MFRIILGPLNFLLTYFLVGSFKIVFGKVKVELRAIKPCSSSFSLSSGFHLNKDDSATPLDIALLT